LTGLQGEIDMLGEGYFFDTFLVLALY